MTGRIGIREDRRQRPATLAQQSLELRLAAVLAVSRSPVIDEPVARRPQRGPASADHLALAVPRESQLMSSHRKDGDGMKADRSNRFLPPLFKLGARGCQPQTFVGPPVQTLKLLQPIEQHNGKALRLSRNRRLFVEECG